MIHTVILNGQEVRLGAKIVGNNNNSVNEEYLYLKERKAYMHQGLELVRVPKWLHESMIGSNSELRKMKYRLYLTPDGYGMTNLQKLNNL
jgi:hypothetical protein|tara:strand:+ start:334 stop:603 length:270 start_codon:yes stop_codon:yes gene_type:complete